MTDADIQAGSGKKLMNEPVFKFCCTEEKKNDEKQKVEKHPNCNRIVTD
jgi:hypothetical protein